MRLPQGQGSDPGRRFPHKRVSLGPCPSWMEAESLRTVRCPCGHMGPVLWGGPSQGSENMQRAALSSQPTGPPADPTACWGPGPQERTSPTPWAWMHGRSSAQLAQVEAGWWGLHGARGCRQTPSTAIRPIRPRPPNPCRTTSPQEGATTQCSCSWGRSRSHGRP